MEEGIVYVLKNPAMPGLVKIGITTRAEVHIRMTELYTTGVPLPFECSFAAKGFMYLPTSPSRNIISFN